ncbi:hypothetical protein CEXT_707471 [Caerostris extrusa]|uniref:Uncharacterized protein n=1 Tax=Caerostris extrusa TaxID=172846 RepID=A0AAV4YA03_CAEEX|nr:hypothetical protein CEXT_707471 [Caerostris extrusa]
MPSHSVINEENKVILLQSAAKSENLQTQKDKKKKKKEWENCCTPLTRIAVISVTSSGTHLDDLSGSLPFVAQADLGRKNVSMTERCSIFTYPRNGREFSEDEIGDSCYLVFGRNDCSWKFSRVFGLRNGVIWLL